MWKHVLLRLGSLLAILALVSATGVAGPADGKGKPGGGGGDEPPPDPEIAYVNDGSLMVMNADGTNQRVVLAGSNNSGSTVHGIGNPDWSPEGDRIAFGATIEDQRGIYVINVDGTGLRLVVASQGPLTAVPRWSPGPIPGGTTVIAYVDVTVPGANSDIYLVDPDAADPTPELLADTPTWFESPCSWSPSATKLAVDINDGSGSEDLWAVYDFVAGTYTLHQHPGPLAGANVSQLGWSKTDETRIAWTVKLPGEDKLDIWIVDLDDPAGAWNLTATETAAERRPTWSPDDTRIAYMTQVPGRGKTTVAGAEIFDMTSGTVVASLAGVNFPSWRR